MAGAPETVEILTPERSWQTVHDTVMGGVSEGVVTALPQGHGVRFTGTVSLDNAGGFASARTVPAPLKLDGIDAIRIEVQGAPRTWSLTARRDDLPIRGGSWRAQFRTTGERQTIELPLATFEAVAFGRPIPDAPPLAEATEHIDSIGFLIGNKQAGPYALTVYGITGIRR